MSTSNKLFLFVIAGLVLYILFLRTCGKVQPCPEAKLVKSEKVYVPVHDTFYSKPTETGSAVPTDSLMAALTAMYAGRTQTRGAVATANQEQNDPSVKAEDYFYTPAPKPADALPDTSVLNTLRNYYTKRFYQDTAKTKYGPLVIRDTVSQNRITGRSVQTLFAIPETTNTVEVPAKPGFQLFAGPMATWGAGQAKHAGLQVMVKMPWDHVFSAGVSFGPVTQYQIGAAFKIKLK